MKEPSKVTKVLINKIHGGRKQDSKFWKSEFSENNNKSFLKHKKNKSHLVEFLSLFFLSVIGLGIVIYGGYFMYNRYKTEFSHPQPNPKIQETPQVQKPQHSQRRTLPKTRIYKPEDKPITKKELDKAVAKAIRENQRTAPININIPMTNFYYQVELVNGSIIEARSASKNGDQFIIKDRQGMEFSLNRKDIKKVMKVPILK